MALRRSFQAVPIVSLVCLCGSVPLLPALQNASFSSDSNHSFAQAGTLTFPSHKNSRARVASPAATAEGNPGTMRVDTNLVMIPAQVTSAIGAPITGLMKEDFRIFENDVEQEIRYFAREDTPVSIGVLLDSSGSMKDKRATAAQAAARFFRAANREDEFFLVEFGDRPHLAVPFTTDSDALYARISHTKPFGRTALYDAVQMALGKMKQAQHTRKAILLFSDGGDNQSRSTFRSIRNAMAESDVQVFAVGIFETERPNRPKEELLGPELLEELTEVTGGQCFPLVSLANLPEVSARIGEQLRNQYVVGYHPAVDIRDGKYRKVRLEVRENGQNQTVNYRRGYYAPSR